MKILLHAFGFLERNGYYGAGVLSLQASLLSRPDLADQVEVRVVQSDVFAELEPVLDGIEDWEPDLLGLSADIWSVDLSETLATRYRTRGGDGVVVFGGTAMSGIDQALVERNAAVDVVVRGEGEDTLAELVRHLLADPAGAQALHALSGITFRDASGGVVRTSNRTVPVDLSAVPSPYRRGYYRPETLLLLETERWCPFRCAYCSWSRTSRRRDDRSRVSLERVRRDLEWSWAEQIETVVFLDSAQNHDTDRLLGVLDLIDGPPLHAGFSHSLFLLFDQIDERQLERLCRLQRPTLLFLGVETFSERALGHCRRPNRLAKLDGVLSALAKNPNLMVMVGLMLGLPDDDLETFITGVERLLDHPQVLVRVAPVSLAPGTELRREAESLEMTYASRGVPFVRSARGFGPGELQEAQARLHALADTGRVSLNTYEVPLRRIRNPESLPTGLRSKLSPNDWVNVSVVGIEDGHVVAAGVYPRNYGDAKRGGG